MEILSNEKIANFGHCLTKIKAEYKQQLTERQESLRGKQPALERLLLDAELVTEQEGVQPEVLVVDIIDHTSKIINTVSEKTDSVILFYSCGKDSICLLDILSKRFKKIYVCYMYFVKNLDHINRFLNYSLKKYPNIELIEIPHWNLTFIHREGVYCASNKNIKLLTIKDIDIRIRAMTNCNYSFYGMKQSDSLNRRLMLKQYDMKAISTTDKIYPLTCWNNLQVLSYLKFNNLPEPICYSNRKKSQGLGFNKDVYVYLRNNYPKDLEKLLKEYPLSIEILYKYDNSVRNNNDKKE